MRRLTKATLAVASLIGTALFAAPQAQAVPASGSFAHQGAGLTEQVALVCPQAYWNGFAWVKPPCYRTAPVVVAPPMYVAPPVYVAPRPYYRRRVYVY